MVESRESYQKRIEEISARERTRGNLEIDTLLRGLLEPTERVELNQVCSVAGRENQCGEIELGSDTPPYGIVGNDGGGLIEIQSQDAYWDYLRRLPIPEEQGDTIGTLGFDEGYIDSWLQIQEPEDTNEYTPYNNY